MRQLTKQTGFSLVEVMIAMFVSCVALLALAAGQLKSLQYANNSFQYTVALIQANNAVERVWADACDLQQGVIAFDQAYIDNTLAPDITGYSMALIGTAANAFNNNFTINVSWTDERINNENQAINDNQININAAFPQLPSTCNAP
ncbi:type IV pilus modification PilV family protein [Shewanella pneumatophori]|uniref:Prepilin-type N-terminal cleavage/methylation domain-containing protein n=1 Tax=Shewanella pneumatophori TaxID=314092 RepID=A0A9X1ZNK1_9GAMM|nr:prepilin-type N-terminal cleavage/methylation domain-containing protein [Shewanella pneumatophori]MCL1139011.1 prepilin-type N-terminal cleavage/methylation domain-containing protein [Shewanella pneumatophori]